MKKLDFANELIKLKITTNRLSWGKDEKSLFSLKYELLFLVGIKECHTPKELIFELCLAKSNIALLCNALCKDGLIIKKKSTTNKKQIEYFITPQGTKMLEEKLKQIDKFSGGLDIKTLRDINKKLGEIK